MSLRIVFHPLASKEFNAAADLYEAVRAGLGEQFIEEIERTIQRIVQNPQAGSIVSGSVRRRLARGFPYAVLYTIKPSRIRVLAIMHVKRRPMYWLGRK